MGYNYGSKAFVYEWLGGFNFEIYFSKLKKKTAKWLEYQNRKWEKMFQFSSSLPLQKGMNIDLYKHTELNTTKLCCLLLYNHSLSTPTPRNDNKLLWQSGECGELHSDPEW